MIAILMATYQGARFIREQMDSILSQTEQGFCLYISDDCSTDGTWEIVQAYARRYPDKISVSQNAGNSGNAKYNFLRLMLRHRDADYIMLCDQDDVWLPHKVESTLAAMQAQETSCGKARPLLVYTDLTVVDQDLRTLDASYQAYMHANPRRTKFCQLLAQNTVTGCTVMYNRALAELLTGEPESCVMHDWWLSLLASAFGEITFLPQPTILYRQHDRNVMGASGAGRLQGCLRILHHYPTKIVEALGGSYGQAFCFAQMYADRLRPEDAQAALAYGRMPKMHKIQRWRALFRYRLFKYGVLRKLSQMIFT